MKLPDSHLVRAGLASLWGYSGRVVGLGWTAALIHQLGIGSYGQYAVGVAAGVIINATIDNAFFTRSLRLDEHRYEQERCARALFGIALTLIGVLCYLEWYVVGFAIVFGGGEMLFNTFKSRYQRMSRPDTAMQYDAFRQVVSIGMGAAYLYLHDEPSLWVASALYLVPYLVIAAVCLRYIPGRRPAFPGGRKEFSYLTSEALAGALYAQGDVLIIGWVAGNEVAGYYSVALVTALAISVIGQNYANTFVEKIREADGHISSLPARSSMFRVSMVTGAAMAVVGVGILIWGGANYTGYIALILALFVVARTLVFSFLVVLVLQHKDSLRVRAMIAVAIIKTIAVFLVVGPFGGYGAAVACVVTEIALMVVYYRAIYVTGAPVVAKHRKEVSRK